MVDEMVVIDTNLKNGTTHITNTEEDHITEVDKLIKITISFIT